MPAARRQPSRSTTADAPAPAVPGAAPAPVPAPAPGAPPIEASGIATILAALATLIVVIVGGVVCIVDPASLSFKSYAEVLGLAIVGNGILGVGHGITSAATTLLSRQ